MARRYPYLGLWKWLLTVDCREGLLAESAANERVQLDQDCKLPSGWELMMEMLSLESESKIHHLNDNNHSHSNH